MGLSDKIGLCSFFRGVACPYIGCWDWVAQQNWQRHSNAEGNTLQHVLATSPCCPARLHVLCLTKQNRNQLHSLKQKFHQHASHKIAAARLTRSTHRKVTLNPWNYLSNGSQALTTLFQYFVRVKSRKEGGVRANQTSPIPSYE